MKISTGPIAFARRGWGLAEKTITSVVSNDGEGHPDVLCAQMLCGAATSGVKTLVLLAGLRTDDLVWQRVGQMLGGGDAKAAAQGLRLMPLRMYASGTGQEHVNKAGLVYVSGLRLKDLQRLSGNTTAPILTLTDIESDSAAEGSTQVIRVSGDAISIDAEGFEVPVTYDPSGPVYRPA
jgi:hypothetical protein